MAFRNIVFSAIIVGIFSGLFYGLFQQTMISPIIYGAEEYEISEDVGIVHSHNSAEATNATDAVATATPVAETTTVADESEEVWAPANGVERILYTLGADILVGIAFAMVMVSLMTLHNFGSSKPKITVLSGALWGVAAMASLFIAPSLFGLHPEVPGTVAAELINRQAWWGFCVLATIAGIAALYYMPMKYKFLGIIAILLPHIIGAPMPETNGFANTDPAAVQALTLLSEEFFLMTTIGMGIFYLTLGSLSGFAVNRFVRLEEN